MQPISELRQPELELSIFVLFLTWLQQTPLLEVKTNNKDAELCVPATILSVHLCSSEPCTRTHLRFEPSRWNEITFPFFNITILEKGRNYRVVLHRSDKYFRTSIFRTSILRTSILRTSILEQISVRQVSLGQVSVRQVSVGQVDKCLQDMYLQENYLQDNYLQDNYLQDNYSQYKYLFNSKSKVYQQ